VTARIEAVTLEGARAPGGVPEGVPRLGPAGGRRGIRIEYPPRRLYIEYSTVD
jgi:hypothetical protein